MTKRECRQKLETRWNECSREEINLWSQSITKHLYQSPLWEESKIILAYLSFKKEISLDKLIQLGIKENKEVYLPYIEKGRGLMNFYRLDLWDSSNLTINKIGIREPKPLIEKKLDLSQIKEKRILGLIPGLGFSRNNIRLGRGGGYYDRYLPTLQSLKADFIGITASPFFLESLPFEEHDIKMKGLCLEKGLLI